MWKDDEAETIEWLRRQVQDWPGTQAQDVVVWLYQLCHGTTNAAHNQAAWAAELAAQLAQPGFFTAQPPQPAPIGQGLVRVYLPALQGGPAAGTLARLCAASTAACQPLAAQNWQRGLQQLRGWLATGQLPFAAGDAAVVDDYLQHPARVPRHSQRYAQLYPQPYVVLPAASALYLPVYAATDRQLDQKTHVLVGIDGMCASGKSTLARQMAEVYGCGVVLADDFFLQPHQRTEERLAQPGGNIDYERLAPVAQQAADDRAFSYQAYNCQIQQLDAWRQVPAGPLTVLEGAYCMNPAVGAAYDVRVFLCLDAAVQMARILHRNGPQMARRFEAEWIPMENRYFAAFGVRESCDVVVDTTTL